MLIPPRLLIAALKDTSVRNHLIRQLNNIPTHRPNSLYFFILSFWLGSHPTRYYFDYKDLSVEVMRTIYKVFFLFLILEKELGSYPAHSSDFRLIEGIRNKMFRLYNANHLLIIKNPQHFINIFSKRVATIPRKFFSMSTKLGTTKWLCEHEIKNPFALEDKRTAYPTTLMIMHNTWRDFFATMVISIVTTRPIMLYPFFSWPADDKLTHRLTRQKIFVRSTDGLVLDGTYVYDNVKPSKTVVIALVAAVQSEHNYLGSTWAPYRNLFASDIIFINHRNYALRSHVLANKLEQLACDVISFVDYFKRQKKDIVLYGMCAGATPMILAANRLTEKQVPYKLILDRSFSDYSSFATFAQIKRIIRHSVSDATSYWELAWQLGGLLGTVCMIKAFYRFSSININFAERLREIPPNDVLILQAKSKKQPGYGEPEFTDFVVHPQNDMRMATKKRRHTEKTILQCLSEQCWLLTHFYVESAISRKIFLRLSCFFDRYLNLIDNEKLMLTPSTTYAGAPTNLHSHKLFELRTRHGMPLAQFIPGFFNKPKRPCDAAITGLCVYNSATILAALQTLHPAASNDALTKVAETMHDFFSSLQEHKNFIIHVGNRLAATQLGNLDVLIKQLLRTPLFRLLDEDKRMIPISQFAHSC